MSTDHIRLMVNGAERKVRSGSTVQDLLEGLGLDRDGIAVAVDHRIVPRSEHPHTPLPEGAKVEVIRAVGGG